MRGACVALLAACLLAASPASGNVNVYDPDGPLTTKTDRCQRSDGAFMEDMVAWAETVSQAIAAYNVEDWTAAKRFIGDAQKTYRRAEDPCSSYAKDVERKCGLAVTYYKIGIEAAAKNDPDKAFRYMRAGHRWVGQATKAVKRLRAYYDV